MAQPHDLECRKCQSEFTSLLVEVPCPRCGSQDVIWHMSVMTSHFTPFWHPNLGHEPVEITSASQLDKELGKRRLHVNEERSRKRVRLPATKREALERF